MLWEKKGETNVFLIHGKQLPALPYAEEFRRNPRVLLFKDKQLRDEVAKLLRAFGVPHFRSSFRNQLLHPQYVDDYRATLELGFGNTQYRTYWPVLYSISPPRF